MKVRLLIMLFTLVPASSLLLLGAQNGSLPEVVIKGKDVLKLESSKPVLDVPVDENREILESLKTEQEIFPMKPTGWEKQPSDSMPDTLKSRQAVIPRTHYIRSEQVKVFYPLSDLTKIFKKPDRREAKKKARWEFIISDDSGKTFHEYSGKGLPPEEIIFDGRNADGRMIEVGYSYSTVLRYYDASGQVHTSVGNPFIATGLASQKKQGYTISIDFKKLYDSEPSVFKKHKFSVLGRDILREAADIIKKKHFGLPVKVFVYGNSAEVSDITSREISEVLTDLLIRSPGEISCAGQESARSVETVEIVVFNQ
jgi:hypothetical protein